MILLAYSYPIIILFLPNTVYIQNAAVKMQTFIYSHAFIWNNTRANKWVHTGDYDVVRVLQ